MISPILKLLEAISRGLNHAHAAFAKNNRPQARRALRAADTLLTQAIAEAIADHKRRAYQYRAPFSNN